MSREKTASLHLCIETLKSIGYADTSTVKRDIEKLLRKQSHRQFFANFTSKVSKGNVLKSDEISQYQELDESKIQNDSNVLQRKINLARARKQDLLAKQASAVLVVQSKMQYKDLLLREIERMQNLEKVNCDSAKELEKGVKKSKDKLEQSKVLNTQTIQKLMKDVAAVEKDFSKLFSHYKKHNISKASILKVSLEGYLLSENDFTAHLTRYVKDQFREDASSINETLTQTYEIMNITDKHLLSYEDETVQENITKDIKLATERYSCQKNALANTKSGVFCSCAILKLLENRLEFYRSSMITPPSLKHLQDLQNRISSVQDRIKYMKGEVLPDLISRGLPLHKTQFVTSNCHKKLAQQKQFTKKQQKVISSLLSQCSRLSLLWMMLKCEASRVRVSSNWLQTLLASYEQLQEDTLTHAGLLKMHPLIAPKKEPKAVIDTRDDVMLDLYKTLVGDFPGDSMFHTFATVRDCAKSLADHAKQFHEIAIRDFSSAYPQLQTMASAVDDGNDDVTSSNGEITLTSEQVHCNLSKLMENVQEIKAKLPAVFDQVKEKKDLIGRDTSKIQSRWIRLLNGQETVDM